jgi:hypothetical protein
VLELERCAIVGWRRERIVAGAEYKTDFLALVLERQGVVAPDCQTGDQLERLKPSVRAFALREPCRLELLRNVVAGALEAFAAVRATSQIIGGEELDVPK